MCSGPLFGPMIRYTIPIILTGVLQLLFNAADLIVVGQFCGNVSVAAVGHAAGEAQREDCAQEEQKHAPRQFSILVHIQHHLNARLNRNRECYASIVEQTKRADGLRDCFNAGDVHAFGHAQVFQVGFGQQYVVEAEAHAFGNAPLGLRHRAHLAGKPHLPHHRPV